MALKSAAPGGIRNRRTASSARWLAEHESDPYVLQSRREGFRSRAVYKLQELDAKAHLLKPGMTVVDLGAAPGGWCQYAQKKLGSKARLIGLDILPIEPLPGVDLILGDFREDAVLAELQSRVNGQGIDLVMSDMAPNVSGIDVADQASSMLLAELALDFAVNQLKPGGTFLVKLFQGEGFEPFLAELKKRFRTVQLKKPKASRPRSREIYALATGLR
jgi:23S rRNA (uridine2552-2'-O)-methyltransferase